MLQLSSAHHSTYVCLIRSICIHFQLPVLSKREVRMPHPVLSTLLGLELLFTFPQLSCQGFTMLLNQVLERDNNVGALLLGQVSSCCIYVYAWLEPVLTRSDIVFKQFLSENSVLVWHKPQKCRFKCFRWLKQLIVCSWLHSQAVCPWYHIPLTTSSHIC